MRSSPDDGTDRTEHVANCPHCGQPHHYVEIKFQGENDHGYWEVDCPRCNQPFVIELNNPLESGGKLCKQIKARHEKSFAGDRSTVAHDVFRHNIDLNLNVWRFNYSATPLYQCAKSSADLEGLAKTALGNEISGVVRAYYTAQNFLLKGGPHHDYAVARVPVTCSCGGRHTATFYARLLMGTGTGPTSENDFLLADVSGAKFEETLDGIVSKDDAMDLLEKLIIRWNLLADQILIVSPFVGTTFMSSEKQLAIWEWLLGMLDSEKSVFLTRGATWMAYRKAMEEDGISVKLLEKFGLENRLVAMDARKQDFHAKFFAGISESVCEVMSGSANLVRGPSVENIGFKAMNRSAFEERYLERMKLKTPLPAPKRASKYWVLIDREPEGWRSRTMFDVPYIEGPQPKTLPESSSDVGAGH
ncbi:hypothetical protein [Pseudomonas reactans]|jgi:hypothetical protein|uniref:hypothetical protein n=1 Tax=Pseudomonas reactans TaxID=117680 RepID=UPI0015A33610|nr:hypothetical protein [Pseudomonas reactans]NWA68524.1 hypothetical protein [Pseudomonas reactans]